MQPTNHIADCRSEDTSDQQQQQQQQLLQWRLVRYRGTNYCHLRRPNERKSNAIDSQLLNSACRGEIASNETRLREPGCMTSGSLRCNYAMTSHAFIQRSAFQGVD